MSPENHATTRASTGEPAELTLRVLVIGAVLSVVMAAANTYLGLKVGMTVSASIPAAVISMAILRGLFRGGTILENNLVQTMASTGESLAAGVIFTVPALVMVGAWQSFEILPTTMIVVLGGLLGVVFMVPMRKALIVDRPDLVYPEGVACSEVLEAGQQGGRGLGAIAAGLGVGAAFKLLETGLGVIRAVVEVAAVRGRSVFYFGSDMSVALLAVGYIVNLRIAALITFGGALGWLVAIPLLGGADPSGDPIAVANALWSEKVRYIGVGTMLIGGVHSIWSVRGGIAAGLAGIGGFSNRDSTVARTERNLSMMALLVIFLATVIATVFFYDSLIGDFPLAALTAGVMVVTAFLFVAVATYIAGLVGSSNSPVSGMTICALLIAAGVLLALGIRGDSAILATLGVAGVVCCATCTSGDIAQDLKTGLLVGATPARQQLVEIIAVLVPAAFFAPILSLLHSSYGIGTGEPGSLAAPQAGLFASLADGFFGEGTLPWNMILIGIGVGAALILLNVALERSGSSFRAHVMPVAVGIYLPFSLDIPILIGGILRAILSKANEGNEGGDRGVLFSSGLIAGEALLGILLAVVLWREIELPSWTTPALVSLALFGGVCWLLAREARRTES
ncbi:MAG: oligopeptide transporter, OPT family [Acidobacteriota bacterium]|nr:oligopeptide transporter, OPT family [Acidobacteriota bacterium]